MEHFAKIVNGWKSLIIFAKSPILDVWLDSECASGQNMGIWTSRLAFYLIKFTKYHITLHFMLTVFAKKLHHRCLIRSGLLNNYLTIFYAVTIRSLPAYYQIQSKVPYMFIFYVFEIVLVQMILTQYVKSAQS